MDNAIYIDFSAAPTRYAVYTTARHFGRLAQRLLRGGHLRWRQARAAGQLSC